MAGAGFDRSISWNSSLYAEATGTAATYWAALRLQRGRLCGGCFLETAGGLLARLGGHRLPGVVLLIRFAAAEWRQENPRERLT